MCCGFCKLCMGRDLPNFAIMPKKTTEYFDVRLEIQNLLDFLAYSTRVRDVG